MDSGFQRKETSEVGHSDRWRPVDLAVRSHSRLQHGASSDGGSEAMVMNSDWEDGEELFFQGIFVGLLKGTFSRGFEVDFCRPGTFVCFSRGKIRWERVDF